jgi:hypothetical protein
MPIEIKEITIKADVYPGQQNSPSPGSHPVPTVDLERLKKELTREITEAVLQKIHQSTER